MAMENEDHPMQELNPSVSPDVLRVASTTAAQLELNLKTDWDPIELASTLHSLAIKDLPLDIITKYRLGRLVKSIKKKAQEKDNKPIVNVSDQIMAKWRDLLPKNDNQAPSRSPTPSPSPVSSPKIGETAITTPSSSSSSTTTQQAPFRLALQKEPTPKAKAVTNTAFFDSLSSSSSSFSTTVRPSFSNSERSPSQHVSLKSLLNNMKRESSTSSSLTSTGTVITRKRTLETTVESSPSSPTLATAETPPPRKARTRRVRFKPDYQLVEVREYEKDPEEWNPDQEAAVDGSTASTLVNHARDMDISEGQAMSQASHTQLPNDTFYPPQPSTMPNDTMQSFWYNPVELLLPDDCALPSPKQSHEIGIQTGREQMTPPIHHPKDMLPPLPTGPHEPPSYQPPAITIPLEEITEEQALVLKQQAMERAALKQQEDMHKATLKHQSEMQRQKRLETKQKANVKKERNNPPPATPVHLLNPYQPSTSYQQGYQPQPAYSGEPSYQPQPAYSGEPSYQPQPAYSGEPSYQPQPAYSSAPSYQPQQQLQPQNFSPPQQLQPQQFLPQQQIPQATAEQLTILLNSGLLGAITDLVKKLPAAGTTSAPGTQPIPQAQQMLHAQTPVYSVPPQQPAVESSSAPFGIASSSAPIPQPAFSSSIPQQQYQPRRPRPPFNNHHKPNIRARGKKKKRFTGPPHVPNGPPGMSHSNRPPPPAHAMPHMSREGAPSHATNNQNLRYTF